MSDPDLIDVPPDLIDVQELAPKEVQEVDLYQKREKIYTRKIVGRFQRLRLFTGWPLLLGFLLLPWFEWHDRQSVLFDLPAREFNIFGLTFWPQDFHLLAWLLIIAAFTLFAITNWLGRVWCGYTCPQTVWTSMFMWAEQFAEGSRNQRIKLDKAPWSTSKLLKKSLKHGMWLTISLITAITFVGYFSPISQLVPNLFTGQASWTEIIAIGFFTNATYLNAGWLREQVCMYMCPYARFQSVMYDSNTLTVAYDPNRGEPRGSRKRGLAKEDHGLGDCISCELCVQVCPTGIDIRDGLQYQCIGCTLCIDACDSVMDKMDYPRGLISYTTENNLMGGQSSAFRPRLMGYVAGILVMTALFTYTIVTRVPLDIEVERDRNQLYTETAEGLVENVYTVKVLNMDQSAHVYRLEVDSPAPLEWIGEHVVTVKAGEVALIPMRLRADPYELATPNIDIYFLVTNDDKPGQSASVESRFIGPTVR
jgi:cytochrome c oxidase accessory protein FixG